MTEVFHRLGEPGDLEAWEPRGGHAIVTCQILVRDAREPRTYDRVPPARVVE